MMASRFWDGMERFHLSAHSSLPNGKQGLEAFRYFKSLLEPYWVDVDSAKHPFHNWVGIASEFHYSHLIMMRRQFELVEHAAGFRTLMKRFAKRAEYLSASTEIGTGIQLRFRGIEISFPHGNSGDTPDIIASIDGQQYWVEVTSINQPSAETSFMNLLGGLVGISVDKKVTIGGFAIAHFTPADAKAMEREVELVAEEVTGRDAYQRVVIQGKAIFFLGSGKKVNEIPEQWRSGFRTWSSRAHPPVERIVAKICDKGRKNYLSGRPGFLVLYDYLTTHGEILNMLENPDDDPGLVMTLHPKMMGMTLMIPSRFIEPRPTPLVLPPVPNREARMMQYRSSGSEMVVLWRNPYAEEELPLAIQSAFLDREQSVDVV